METPLGPVAQISTYEGRGYGGSRRRGVRGEMKKALRGESRTDITSVEERPPPS